MTKAELEAQSENLMEFLISLRDAIDDKLDELTGDDEDDDAECVGADAD
ncbi:MAG TPA: hypothetical protein VGF97_06755 [Rhizomicrobium sp.]|jgi:hypothetical protein